VHDLQPSKLRGRAPLPAGKATAWVSFGSDIVRTALWVEDLSREFAGPEVGASRFSCRTRLGREASSRRR
jgi:hypothetical protein